MLNLLDRTIASIHQRLVLLAPPDIAIPDHFNACEFDLERHDSLLEAVQRFRGSIYYQDGAIGHEQLTADGRHRTAEDTQSWHLLMLNGDGSIGACAWYRDYDSQVYFDRLRLKQCALANEPQWRDALWKAVECEIAAARRDGLRYAELGGWAVAPENRASTETVLLALATYALSRSVGGALGVTTATSRHQSSTILRRLGGRPLEVDGTILPPYHDPHYNCVMEIVRFDSRAPHARYNGVVNQLHGKLLETPVIARPYWPAMRSRGFSPMSTPSFNSVARSPELAA